MKKVFLSLLLLAGIATVNAQDIKFGINAGVTFASQKGKTSGVSITSDSRAGFTVGGQVDVPLGSSFVFQPGLSFTQKGGKFDLTFMDYKLESNTSLNYLELPLNFLYQANAGTGKFFAGAGPSLAFGLGGKAKNTETENGVTLKSEEDINFGNKEDDDFKPLEIGANILAGYEFSNGIFVAANYNLGLNDIAADGSDATAKNRYFGVKVGFKFGGKATKK